MIVAALVTLVLDSARQAFELLMTNELLAEDCETVEIETRLDEHNLTVVVRYKGRLPELSTRRPGADEMIEDPDAMLRMAGYLVHRLADSVRTRADAEQVELRMIFRD